MLVVEIAYDQVAGAPSRLARDLTSPDMLRPAV
jgi:hypothetical protein